MLQMYGGRTAVRQQEISTFICFMSAIFLGTANAALAAESQGLHELTNECDIALSGGTDPCLSLPFTSGTGINTTDAAVIRSSDASNDYPLIYGARSLAGSNAAMAIDAHGYCRYVDNGSANAIFIPFKSKKEWVNGFITTINKKSNGIKLSTCSRGSQNENDLIYIHPNDADNIYMTGKGSTDARLNQCKIINGLPASHGERLPYKKYGTTVPTYTPTDIPFTFKCTSPDGTPFNETVTEVGFIGLNSGERDGTLPPPLGWVLNYVKYSYDGICGDANGVASATAPTTNLCHVGKPSAVSKKSDGTWGWTCSNGNGGGQVGLCGAEASDAPVNVSLSRLQCNATSGPDTDIAILLDSSQSMESVVKASQTVFKQLLSKFDNSKTIKYSVMSVGGTGGYTPENGSGDVCCLFDKCASELQALGMDSTNCTKNCFYRPICAYGHLMDFGTHTSTDLDAVASKLAQIKSNTNTPLVSAMRYTAETDLSDETHARAMIVISDGAETCADISKSVELPSSQGGQRNSNQMQADAVQAVQELRNSGIKMYGVRIWNGVAKSVGLRTYDQFDAYNQVLDSTTSALTAGTFGTALKEMLDKAVSTATDELTAKVYTTTTPEKFVGTLTSSTTLSLQPGSYKIEYFIGTTKTSSEIETVTADLQLGTKKTCQ